MSEWSDRDERQADGRAEYERIMTTPSPDPTGAYIDAGVIGYVFAEMWRRGVLTARDRRWITLSCVGAAGAPIPIETHVWAALNGADISYEEYDEFVLFFGTQLGWPRASLMQTQGMISIIRLAEERGVELKPHEFELWADPIEDDARRVRGESAYADVHGVAPQRAETAFRRRAYLDYLYGEVWTRERYLTRRDRRIISICCAGAAAVDDEVCDHLRAALALKDLTYEELQELVMHYAVYLGWTFGRRLDDLLVAAARDAGLA